jgi:uncharacterized protein YbjQ (UPF0145 family)
MEGIFPSLLIFLVLTAVGYFCGAAAERRHYRSIREREGRRPRPVLLTRRTPPVAEAEIAAGRLVSGSAVVSNDYFKGLLAGLRNLIGGRLASYESLLDRARREALLRMQAAAEGCDLILNVRLETTAVGGSDTSRRGVTAVEVLAYGTALTLRRRA